MITTCYCNLKKRIKQLEKELLKNSKADAELAKKVDEIEHHGVTPGSIGSEEIQNDSILMEDLSQGVRDQMSNIYDDNNDTLYLNTSNIP